MTFWPRSGADALLTPVHGRGVCQICFNLITVGDSLCRACRAGENHLDVVVPISYSVGGSWLHAEIAAYKRDADPFVPVALGDLAELLERFLERHEHCVGRGEAFDVVTVVPSSDAARDRLSPLRTIVERSGAVGDRHRRLLEPSGRAGPGRMFCPARFRSLHPLAGERVLLIDDMWTTGASAQSAAAVLRDAGASNVAAVVIGRHLNRGYADNAMRLRELAGNFTLSGCAICTPARSTVAGA